MATIRTFSGPLIFAQPALRDFVALVTEVSATCVLQFWHLLKVRTHWDTRNRVNSGNTLSAKHKIIVIAAPPNTA